MHLLDFYKITEHFYASASNNSHFICVKCPQIRIGTLKKNQKCTVTRHHLDNDKKEHGPKVHRYRY